MVYKKLEDWSTAFRMTAFLETNRIFGDKWFCK